MNLQKLFDAFSESNNSTNYYLRVDKGGCFCVATDGQLNYIAVSGAHDYTGTKCQKTTPRTDAEKAVDFLAGLFNNHERCCLTDNFLLPKQNIAYRYRRVRRLSDCQYEIFGQRNIKNIETECDGRDFCAERKVLSKILEEYFTPILYEGVAKWLVGKTLKKDSATLCIELYNFSDTTKSYKFYCKYEPCDICFPLMQRFEFYALKYNGQLGPYKIKFANERCVVMKTKMCSSQI